MEVYSVHLHHPHAGELVASYYLLYHQWCCFSNVCIIWGTLMSVVWSFPDVLEIFITCAHLNISQKVTKLWESMSCFWLCWNCDIENRVTSVDVCKKSSVTPMALFKNSESPCRVLIILKLWYRKYWYVIRRMQKVERHTDGIIQKLWKSVSFFD